MSAKNILSETDSPQYCSAYTFLMYEVFGALEKLDGALFTMRLKWLLYDWLSIRLISYDTFQKLVSTLKLNKKWSYLESNPDGSITVYLDMKLWDTFRIEDLGAWMVKTFLEDVNFKFYEEIFGNGAYKEILNVMKFPDGSSYILAGDEKGECSIQACNKVFWTEKVKTGRYKLYYISKPDKENFFEQKEKMILATDIQKEIIYSNHFIYARMCDSAAYLRYDITSGKTEIVKNAYLLNVTNSGREWSLNSSWMLQYRTVGQEYKMVPYRQVEKNSNITVYRTDDILVTPGKMGTHVFRPYRITSKGNKKLCSMHFSANHIWGLLVDSFYPLQKIPKITCFTEVLESEKVREAPSPFTISQIRKDLKEWKLSGTDDFIKFLSMLEEKGIDENKDITAICYGLWGKKTLQKRKEN